jgi:hypothetical protein
MNVLWAVMRRLLIERNPRSRKSALPPFRKAFRVGRAARVRISLPGVA